MSLAGCLNQICSLSEDQAGRPAQALPSLDPSWLSFNVIMQDATSQLCCDGVYALGSCLEGSQTGAPDVATECLMHYASATGYLTERRGGARFLRAACEFMG